MRTTPIGTDALLVELLEPDGPDPTAVVALARWARERRVAVEVVPGATTVLLDGVADVDALRAALAAWTPPVTTQGDARKPGGAREPVEVGVVYDGPDLDDVARHWGVSPQEVVARHTGTEFVSAFCGFAPGFAYLAGLPTSLAVPRLDSPRARVAPGSVGLAGAWCGVYPSASPGGWRLLGRTEVRLWDAGRAEPALLAPGTRVRFTAVRASA